MSDSGSGSAGSFFGLIVKPNKRYDTVVREAFHVTKACLEPSTAGDKVTSLYLEHDSEDFIVANLDKKNLNEPLDLGFSIGEKVCFKVDGPGVVHVTGNVLEDETPDFMDGSMLEDSMMTEEDDMETPQPKKRKKENNKKDAKKIKLDSSASNGKADDEESSSDEDDSDDDEDDETGGETTTLSDLDSTANFAEEEDSEEEDDSDDGEEEEEDDDDDDSDDDSEEDSEEVQTPSPKKSAPKMNGDVSPSKKAKLEAAKKTPSKEAPKEEKKPKSPKKTEEKKEVPKTPKDAGKKEKGDKTPKPDAAAAKTPKASNHLIRTVQDKTPKPEAKTPKGEQQPKTPKEGKTPKGDKNAVATPKSTKKVTKGGVQVEDIKVGNGPEVKPGRPLGMYYTGRLQTNNKQFDSCQKGKPFKFRLGAGEVIKGWDVGIMGMKVGGKRKLTIPPNMAYGAQGAPPDIPPNSTLVFEIECKFAS